MPVKRFPPEPIHNIYYDVVLIDALADDFIQLNERDKERLFREVETLVEEARKEGQITSMEEETLKNLIKSCKVFIESDIPEEEYRHMREFGKDPCSILYDTAMKIFIDKSAEIWQEIKRLK